MLGTVERSNQITNEECPLDLLLEGSRDLSGVVGVLLWREGGRKWDCKMGELSILTY